VPDADHLALALRNWSLDRFRHSTEPSFFLSALDRDETSLLTRRAAIPRTAMHLWIAIRMVAIANALGWPD